MTSASASGLTVAHQAWGVLLATDDASRSRVLAWREGCGLAGVLAAAVLGTTAGPALTGGVLAVLLAVACAAWWTVPRPPRAVSARTADWRMPLQVSRFRTLLAIQLLNGIASAVPATLVLFFVQDRLQVDARLEPAFLAAYFVAAAAALPLWLRCAAARGLAATWLAGMLLAVATFAFCAGLGAGDAIGFGLVCVLSGAALGTDLALAPALLAREIEAAGWRGQADGAFFGWWNFAAKLNLALAAGLTLPLLQLAGYAPGTRDPGALHALTLAYCLLPCVLKLAAAGLLARTASTPEPRP